MIEALVGHDGPVFQSDEDEIDMDVDDENNAPAGSTKQAVTHVLQHRFRSELAGAILHGIDRARSSIRLQMPQSQNYGASLSQRAALIMQGRPDLNPLVQQEQVNAAATILSAHKKRKYVECTAADDVLVESHVSVRTRSCCIR